MNQRPRSLNQHKSLNTQYNQFLADRSAWNRDQKRIDNFIQFTQATAALIVAAITIAACAVSTGIVIAIVRMISK